MLFGLGFAQGTARVASPVGHVQSLRASSASELVRATWDWGSLGPAKFYPTGWSGALLFESARTLQPLIVVPVVWW